MKLNLQNKPTAIILNFQSDHKVSALAKAIEPAVAKIIVIDNSKINRGFAAGVNLGIRQALEDGADSVLLLNPDLIITSEQIKALSEIDGGVIGPVLTFTRQGKLVYDFGGKINWLLGRTTHLEEDSLERRRLLKLDLPVYISGACMLINTKVFKKIGLFDERFFLYFEDADFCLRAKKAGFSVVVNPKVIVEHQISEHRSKPDQLKASYLLESNRQFITKWIPWFFKPVAFLYWLLLFFRYRKN